MASLAGPAGIRVGSPKKSTCDTAAGQVAFGHQADKAVVTQAVGQHLERRPLPAGQRHDLEAQALAVVDEAVIQRLRLEPLGDGGEGAVVLHQPHPGHVPVAAVRQRHHRALAARERRIEVVPAVQTLVEAHPQLVHVHRWQPERLPPVARVGGQRSTDQLARHLGGRDPEDPGQVLAQLIRAATAARRTTRPHQKRCGRRTPASHAPRASPLRSPDRRSGRSAGRATAQRGMSACPGTEAVIRGRSSCARQPAGQAGPPAAGPWHPAKSARRAGAGPR